VMDIDVLRLFAALELVSDTVSIRSMSPRRSAEELNIDTPAAAMAKESATVMANMRPGVVVMKFQMRRIIRAGPAKVDNANWVAGLNTGLDGSVTSSNQWSCEP